MLVEFEELPEDARIWVYQSDRAFTEKEKKEIAEATGAFLTQWTVHGSDLQAGYLLPYDRFIVIGLDQRANSASGCSIDASVHFIQALERRFGLSLLDRMNVTYRQGEHFAHKPLADFRKMAKDRAVSPRTVVFNNLVNNKYEFENDWEIPASESWHNRFF